MNSNCCQSNQSSDSCCTPAETAAERKVAAYLPSVDVIETPDELRIVADVPGATAEGVDITFEERTLTLRAAVRPRDGAPAAHGRRALHREYGVGDYVRSFVVHELIDRDRVEASLDDGVLTLRLPKAEAVRPRKIQVRAASTN